MDAVNLDAMLARFAEQWAPKQIAQVNDYDVRIVKLQGVWFLGGRHGYSARTVSSRKNSQFLLA
jgi:hypothetical protein